MPPVTVIFVGTDGIDRESGLPPYRELARQLRERIESGELRGRLPTEIELGAQWGVSKTVVRKALALLREAGLVETHHGFGSRVIPPEERQGG